MSDTENEFGAAGDAPAPETAEGKAGDSNASPQSRPFRSWGSAQEESKASVWDRFRKFFEAPTEIVPHLALRPKPGFFQRLFRRKKQSARGPDSVFITPVEEPLLPTNEYPVDAEPGAAAFASVDEALPHAAETAADDAESKQGMFARLFGRKSKRLRSSADIEIHEDRIAAAADALEQVGERTFAEQIKDGELATSGAFESVDEALPDTSDSKFAPPAEFLGHPLETPEIELIENDRDTDEFEVVTDAALAAAPPSMDVDEDTAQVSPKSLLKALLWWRSTTEAKKKSDLSAAATIVEPPPVFLFSKFRMFYNEIIRLKHQKTELTAGFSTAIITDHSAELGPEEIAETTSKNLESMLDLQAAEAMWMGGEAAERYPEAQYAMAALADDLLQNMEWEGQSAWHKHLLEQKLFKTRASEVELFRRIDRLLKDQPNSASARDLARVYLFVIAAGFKGKYRPFGLSRPLAEYRQRLFEFIHRGADALMLYDPDRRIFPEASNRTLVGHAVSKYSAAQRWAAILVFLVVSYTVVAHVAWTRVSADLEDVTQRIKSTTTTTP